MAIAGYTISSTGGVIASYAISPSAPTGTSFSTSTGLLSGTPSVVQVSTNYSITATNATSTATQTFTLTVRVPCAQGGVCAVGDTGPGGGKVFYVHASGTFACGATLSQNCTYLEVAPNTWSGGSVDPSDLLWAVSAHQSSDISTIANNSSAFNDALGIGLGYKNSLAIVGQGNNTTTAAGAARAYAGGSQSDWYLPTTAELNVLCQWARNVAQSVTTACTGGTLNTGTGALGGFSTGYYWSSSEDDANNAWVQNFYDGYQSSGSKDNALYVRRVRAFSASCATGGVCAVGDTGPGGGKVFYVHASGTFACGATLSQNCTYLEVAPNTWSGGSVDPSDLLWAVSAHQSSDISTIANNSSAFNDALGIGLGYKNSLAIVGQGNNTTTAAGAARAYGGGSQSDWYLPSTAELNVLCQWARDVAQSVATRCSGGSLNTGTGVSGGFSTGTYWSSSELSGTFAWYQTFGYGTQNFNYKNTTDYVRPVRAF